MVYILGYVVTKCVIVISAEEKNASMSHWKLHKSNKTYLETTTGFSIQVCSLSGNSSITGRIIN